jgi:hypothetical protein
MVSAKKPSHAPVPLKPVFQICDILIWIRMRIRILGSVPLTYESGSGSGSCSFRQ